jgi:hypothetical protein
MQIELQNLQREVGITFVLVTHDQEEALSMSDTISIMRDGRIVQSGPPSELYDAPINRYVADFVGESNFFGGTSRPGEAGGAAIALPDGSVFAGVHSRRAQVPAAGARPDAGPGRSRCPHRRTDPQPHLSRRSCGLQRFNVPRRHSRTRTEELARGCRWICAGRRSSHRLAPRRCAGTRRRLTIDRTV